MTDSQNHQPKNRKFRWGSPQGIALLVGLVGAAATIVAALISRPPTPMSNSAPANIPAPQSSEPSAQSPVSSTEKRSTDSQATPQKKDLPRPVPALPAGNSLPGPSSAKEHLTGNAAPITVRTRAGQEIRLKSLELGIYVHGGQLSFDDRFLGFSAIPLENGIRVSFSHVTSARFGGSNDKFGPVEIKLIDGSTVDGHLGGVEEVRPGMTVIGESPYGKFQAELADLHEVIFLQSAEERVSLPRTLPEGPTAAVFSKAGGVQRISSPTLEFIRRIPGSTGSCEVLAGSAVRTVEGLIVPFDKIREIRIVNDGSIHINPVPIELIAADGQRLMTSLVALGGPADPIAEPCWGWRLKGKVEIGDFALSLISIDRIVFDH
jgi:hypothetical protein